ncbi:MAG: phosphate regulon transcriptional regulator PhoB [Alphaproteobacteria bacterium]|nr:phosphate regulon transcriptional regulator PhoB [Alphaproteobacteria bacterium]
MKPLILIVEDETPLVTMLRYNLEKEGFRVAAAVDGQQALLLLAEERPDLVLLDWMLPSISGLELCRRIRRRAEWRDLPVVMLTARAEEADRVRGLEIGADDYVTKPFSRGELIARIRALLRRSRPAFAEEVLTRGNLSVDLVRHRVSRGGRAIELSPTEYRLLLHFMENPGRVFSRDQLLNAVWGRDTYVEERTVDVHIRRLRKALNREGETDIVRTVRSAGYAFALGDGSHAPPA